MSDVNDLDYFVSVGSDFQDLPSNVMDLESFRPAATDTLALDQFECWNNRWISKSGKDHLSVAMMAILQYEGGKVVEVVLLSILKGLCLKHDPLNGLVAYLMYCKHPEIVIVRELCNYVKLKDNANLFKESFLADVLNKAVKSECLEICDFMLDQLPLRCREFRDSLREETALHTACRVGNLDIIKLLLSNYRYQLQYEENEQMQIPVDLILMKADRANFGNCVVALFEELPDTELNGFGWHICNYLPNSNCKEESAYRLFLRLVKPGYMKRLAHMFRWKKLNISFHLMILWEDTIAQLISTVVKPHETYEMKVNNGDTEEESESMMEVTNSNEHFMFPDDIIKQVIPWLEEPILFENGDNIMDRYFNEEYMK